MRAQTERIIKIKSGLTYIEGMLAVPENALGVVLFAHGSGSGRFSPRNQFVAEVLREGGVGTLLMDLLDSHESEDRRKVFDIGLLAERLLDASEWIKSNPDTKDLPIGYFGASTGAAAALRAAAIRPENIKAVVSRGGRPDLAMEYLPQVTAPTLLIVGGEDYPVIPLNQEAYAALPRHKELIVIPGATHLFEEPGALDKVARYARDWFQVHLIDHGQEEEPRPNL